jgi:CubicO group peptidase (beta-lactamase class C family)
MKMRIQEFIEHLRKETGVAYIDVICKEKHKTVFRYVSGNGVTGKEQLYMYSCSKVITVVAALRLVEEGKISLEDKVCKYLPEIEKAFIAEENGEKRIVGQDMTLRHLFTMSAGFTYNLATEPIIKLAKESNGQAVLRDFISKFVETPLSFCPGARFQYSLCHDVLAAVVEVVTGKRFSAYIQESIFTPLGMRNSCFDNSEQGVFETYAATEAGEIYLDTQGKLLMPTKAYESGGAGLVSTVEDYSRFADALACGGVAENGYQVIKKETLELLRAEQFKGLSLNNGFTCVQGNDYGYGLGVRVRTAETQWGLPKGEFGWDGAAGSYVMVDPKREVSVFIGMNILNWPAVFAGKHLQIVERLYQQFF